MVMQNGLCPPYSKAQPDGIEETYTCFILAWHPIELLESYKYIWLSAINHQHNTNLWLTLH